MSDGVLQRWVASVRDQRTVVGRGLRRLLGVSIVGKVLIANSVIILIGAVGGTWLTDLYVHRLHKEGVHVELMGLFALAGILLGVVVYSAVLRLALRPLAELERTARLVQGGDLTARVSLGFVSDPDTRHLAETMNAMLTSLEAQQAEARQQAAALEAVLSSQAELGLAMPERLPQVVAEVLARALGLPKVRVYVFTLADGGVLELGGAVGWAADVFERMKPMLRFQAGTARGLVGLVAATRRAIYVPDTLAEPRWVVREEGTGSAYVVPLGFGERLFAVAVLIAEQPDGIPLAVRALADLSAHYVGSALEVARLLHEVREANVQLQQAQQELARQERLHALGQMASGVAHDFNNALTPVLGFAELLLARPEVWSDPQQMRAYVEGIQTAARDAGDVVARLRAFYRQREGEEPFTPVNLNALVESALRLGEPRWRGEAQRQGISIGIERDLAPLPEVAVLEGEVRQALLNAIFNAADAMPQGGTLTLRTRSGPLPETALPVVAYGDSPPVFVAIEVGDTGVGMDARTIERCVEPFYSTKGERGTGLGLASVYGTVRRHEGRLEIASAPGQGTMVRMYLPTALAVSLPRPAGPALATRAAPRRVLVVDDEPAVRAFIAAALRAEGHSVIQVASGEEALAALARESVDLLITDHGMPGMLGLELAARVRARWPRLPIILCTGYTDLSPADSTLGDVDEVLSKPVHLEALRLSLARVLAATQSDE